MKINGIHVILAAALLPLGAGAQQGPADLALVAEGAQVYAWNCTRCHNARSSMERTDAEWVAVVNHMRARANLSRSQADALLAFFQATNLPEGAPTAVAPAGNVDATRVVLPSREAPPGPEGTLIRRRSSPGPAAPGGRR